jgi:monoamine oxidase
MTFYHQAFAERLRDKIILDAVAAEIEQDGSGIKVRFARYQNDLETIRGDLLLVAIPFPPLSKIKVTPRFSNAKADVIRTIRYESVSRMLLETKTRFWHEKGLNGFALRQDLAEIWEGSFGQAGTHGIIQNYLRYDASLALTRQVHAERLTATVGALEKFFPGLGANYVKGFSKCWSEDIWSGGAWGLLAGKRLEDGRAPEGRIFFAGEHLSGHASWMQGALQSGLAAVEGIKAFRPVSRGAI